MVYLIMGSPGTGKTYFAKALAERLGAAHANTDSVREEEGLMGQYDPESKKRVYEELFQRMLKTAESGKDMVVDATFVKQAHRDRFIDPLEERGIPYQLIRMVADPEIVKQRVQKDRADSEAGVDVYEKLQKEFELPKRKHITLDSGTMGSESMLERVMSETENPLE